MPPPQINERLLAWWLRLAGLVCASALLAVVMPQSWHVATHAWLGLGEFPAEPIAEYLARGMSGMCGLFGLLLLWLARDVRQYSGAIGFVTLALMGISLVATIVMLGSGMPAWWLWGDVLSVWGFGLVALWLLPRGDTLQDQPG